MPSFFCNSCGLQYAPSDQPPARCALCEDERHRIGPDGQSWSTLDQIAKTRANMFRAHEPGLVGIGPVPSFGCGQRALLVRTGADNILWDCVALIDDLTVEIVKGLGGLKAIVVSHPHHYSGMIAWSKAFGGVPIMLHAADKKWNVYRDPAVTFWDGDSCVLTKDITLIRIGGQFAGGTVAHWAKGAVGKGALLVGDLITIAPDNRSASFLRSVPNGIPLSVTVVERIRRSLEPFDYDVMYGAVFDSVVRTDAKQTVKKSIERHIKWIKDDGSLAAL